MKNLWYLDSQPVGKDGDTTLCKKCEWKPYKDKVTKEIKFGKAAPWLRIQLRHIDQTAEHEFFRLTCTAIREEDDDGDLVIVGWKYNIRCPQRLIDVSTVKTVKVMELVDGVAYGKNGPSLGCTTKAGMIRHLDKDHSGTSEYVMRLFDEGIAELIEQMAEDVQKMKDKESKPKRRKAA